MTKERERMSQQQVNQRMPHRGLSLAVLIVNQLLAGVGVASGIAVAAILVADLTGANTLGGLAQSASVLGAAITAIPLARLAVRAGRHVALATGYACAFVGAVLVIAAAASGLPLLVFLGLAAFGAGAAAGLQARFAATEVAAPGFEARSMSLVLWATTIGSVAGPLLAEVGDEFGIALGLPSLVGPFIFSGIAFALSSILVATLLRTPKAGHLATDDAAELPEPDAARPDTVQPLPELVEGSDGPVGVASTSAANEAGSANERGSANETGSGREAPRTAPEQRIGAWTALRTAVRNPTALVAILAIVCSHTVMIGVMVMTPVHMTEHGLSLSLVGVVLSIHILGMYGASPIMGWLADRIGSARVIVIGAGLLVSATVIGILAPAENMLLIPLALGLLGLGWSAGLIGGSTLLTTAVDPQLRVPLQGATDATMNIAAATSAAFSGLVLGLGGFAGVNVVAIFVLVPLAIAGLRLIVIRRGAPA
jgi:MFS family permease